MKFTRWLVVVGATLAVAPVTWIGSAYATQLNPARKPFIPSNVVLGVTTALDPFLKRLFVSVQNNRSTLLWSVYPASVRGQVVVDAVPGSDPLQTGGW
jgi:hypothetical protein